MRAKWTRHGPLRQLPHSRYPTMARSVSPVSYLHDCRRKTSQVMEEQALGAGQSTQLVETDPRVFTSNKTGPQNPPPSPGPMMLKP